MSNKTDKPKMSSQQIVQMMRDDKGIKFNYTSEEEAEHYLKYVNNYMRTAAYRKNYTKIQGGANDGKYENLEFAYLQELSAIDMHLRFMISKMCLDIEHALKVQLLNDIEIDEDEDGYEIVEEFFEDHPNIIRSLESKTSSPFTGDLINKYFTIESSTDLETGRVTNTITAYDDCPIWVVVELLAYGEFIKLYKLYYGLNAPVGTNLLQLVRSLRNGTAHNNCIIANLQRETSRAPAEVKDAVRMIDSITKTQKQKNLSSRPMLEFATLLYVFNKVVSPSVKQNHKKELKELFEGRMLEKKEFFDTNPLIINSYRFAYALIDGIIK